MKIVNHSGYKLKYETEGSVGMDVRAIIVNKSNVYSGKDIYSLTNANPKSDLYMNLCDRYAELGFDLTQISLILDESVNWYINRVKHKLEDTIIIEPYSNMLIGTGIHAELPEGYEIQVRPRSSVNLKSQIDVKLGTIDSDYRGDIGLIVRNTTPFVQFIELNERFAQLVVNKIERPDIEFVNNVEELSNTSRGSGGFGSTNK